MMEYLGTGKESLPGTWGARLLLRVLDHTARASEHPQQQQQQQQQCDKDSISQ
jgi:hypothetical protein